MKLWKISDIRHVKKENVTFRLILIKSSSFLRFFFYDKKFFLSLLFSLELKVSRSRRHSTSFSELVKLKSTLGFMPGRVSREREETCILASPGITFKFVKVQSGSKFRNEKFGSLENFISTLQPSPRISSCLGESENINVIFFFLA